MTPSPRYVLTGRGNVYGVYDTHKHEVRNDELTKAGALALLNELNTPRRPTWDETWMAIAHVIAARSKCSRRQVGAVIITADNQQVAASYNGAPAGMNVVGRCIDWCARAQSAPVDEPPSETTGYHNCPSIHAEANALLFSDRTRIAGGTIYVTSAVCIDCAKLIANSGLKRVVMEVHPGDLHRDPVRVAAYLADCGVKLTVSKVGRPPDDED